ncbi:Gfo/Idh/MocA family oxidoreductase [Phytomonospora sp. NPDC050363]|uniref:Gfo/Idh/MocA family protein n=1 Tax=Phytomonospora sp. NPDC050363 TaxID=3155642 RepID=UPI00340C78D3
MNTHHNLRPGHTLDRPLRVALVGAGARGAAYASLVAQAPSGAAIVAVAEPRDRQREQIAAEHGLEPQDCHADWRDLAAAGRVADAVIIATQDADHVEPALIFAALGYDILLEKPLALSAADCLRIGEAVRANDVTLAVCHVMRYTRYTKKLVSLIAEGAVGDVIGVQHLEPIGWWHFAHSYVRGNWNSIRQGSPMLLAKSSHDIDWLAHVVGRRALRVSSFGSLTHFRHDRRPEGAAARCLDCKLSDSCAYSAQKLYLEGRYGEGVREYFTLVAADALDDDSVQRALREGPYGRCVYDHDNDVCDNQVVNIEYEGGVTASFTVTAFTPQENRHTKVFGSGGQLTGDGRRIEVLDFTTNEVVSYDTDADGASAADGHGGGDRGLIEDFCRGLSEGRPELITSNADASVASHRVVFAAEEARLAGSVVKL